MHTLTGIQEAFQKDPDDLIYIITFQLCLFVILSHAVMYIYFLLPICTLRCVYLSFYLGLRATCDLWLWFMWFFHSTYVSCQSVLHARAHHTDAHMQVFHLYISSRVRLQQCKRMKVSLSVE